MKMADFIASVSAASSSMERETLQAIAVARASCGDFKEALKHFYLLKEKQIHDQRALNRTEVQIAAILYLQGEFEESLKLYTQTLEKMERRSEEYVKEIFEAKCNVAAIYSRKLKGDLAGQTYDELRNRIGTLPALCPNTIEFKRNLALSLMQSGEFQSALEMFTEVHQSRKVIHGESDWITEYSHAEVAKVLLELGKYQKALSILEKAEKAFQTTESSEEIFHFRLKRYLADAHMHLGLTKIAEDLYKSSMRPMQLERPNHPDVLITMHRWGRLLAMMKKTNEALSILKEAYRIRFEQSPKHPDTARIALDITTIYLNHKDYVDAVISFVNVPAQISSTFKWYPDLLLDSVTSVASSFDASEDARIKEQLPRAYQHVFEKQFEMRGSSDHHKDVLQTRTRMGKLLIDIQKPEEALKILKDVLEKRTLVLKNDYIDCIDVIQNIANAYSDLKQYVEAFEYSSEVLEMKKLITGLDSDATKHWKNKILSIEKEMEKSVLIDAVVSHYRISIKSSADSENVSMEDNFPLHVAAETGRIAMVKFLLFKGVIYNEENSEGKTPTDMACNNAVRNFFNFIDDLFLAVRKVDRERIDQILDIMDDVNVRDGDVARSPLLLAGLFQVRDIIDKTILNTRDETGSTPLHLACSSGDVSTVKRLLALQVDSTLTDKSNRSPRDVAESKSFPEILQLLDTARITKNLDGSAVISMMVTFQENPEIPEESMDQ